MNIDNEKAKKLSGSFIGIDTLQYVKMDNLEQIESHEEFENCFNLTIINFPKL